MDGSPEYSSCTGSTPGGDTSFLFEFCVEDSPGKGKFACSLLLYSAMAVRLKNKFFALFINLQLFVFLIDMIVKSLPQ
jgi:hypothetical protein